MPNRRPACGASGAYTTSVSRRPEPGLHAARGLAPGAHRLDHGRRAGDDVAAGKDAGDRRREVLVGLDVAALVELELRGLAEDRVGVGADREDDAVALELELAAGHRHRAAAARRVGLAQLHPLAAHAAHALLAVVEHLDRAGQPVELDAFLAGVMDLLGPRRRLGLAAAVDAVDLLGAEPQRHAHRVHRGVAGADHGDALARLHRRVEVGEVARRASGCSASAARWPTARR